MEKRTTPLEVKQLNRRRFLKYAGATAAAIGASAVGVDSLIIQKSSIQTNVTPSPTPTISSSTETTSAAQTSTTKTPIVPPEDFVQIRDGKFLFKKNTFVLKGFNYYPRDHGWRIFSEWDQNEADRELGFGSDLYANSIRTFINYPYSTNNVDYQYDWRTNYHVSDDYLENVEAFLALCAKHNLKAVLSLFDYAYWELFSPNGQSVAEAYLNELIPKFANDPRIMAWDIVNQPDVTASLMGTSRTQDVATFLQRMSDKIKSLDENHPITICFGDPSNPPVANVWHGLLAGAQPHLDFLSFQNYAPPDRLYSRIQELKKFGQPIVIMEFGKHTWSQDPQDPSNETLQMEYYRSLLSSLNLQSISGSMFWTLMDFPVEHNPCVPSWGMCFPVDKGESRENHFGVYRTDDSPKPATDIVKQYYVQ